MVVFARKLLNAFVADTTILCVLLKQLILISCVLENTPQIKSNFVKSARKDNTKIDTFIP